jgi:hypothetical protein
LCTRLQELQELDQVVGKAHDDGAAALAHGSDDGLAGTRVLVVDDSPANLRFAVFALKRLGCVTETCADGDQVVRGAPMTSCSWTSIWNG